MPVSFSLGTWPLPLTVCSARLSDQIVFAFLTPGSSECSVPWGGQGWIPAPGDPCGQRCNLSPFDQSGWQEPWHRVCNGILCSVYCQLWVWHSLNTYELPSGFDHLSLLGNSDDVIPLCWASWNHWYPAVKSAKVMHKVWPTERIFCRVIITKVSFTALRRTHSLWCASWTKQEHSHTAAFPSSALEDTAAVGSWHSSAAF